MDHIIQSAYFRVSTHPSDYATKPSTQGNSGSGRTTSHATISKTKYRIVVFAGFATKNSPPKSTTPTSATISFVGWNISENTSSMMGALLDICGRTISSSSTCTVIAYFRRRTTDKSASVVRGLVQPALSSITSSPRRDSVKRNSNCELSMIIGRKSTFDVVNAMSVEGSDSKGPGLAYSSAVLTTRLLRTALQSEGRRRQRTFSSQHEFCRVRSLSGGRCFPLFFSLKLSFRS